MEADERWVMRIHLRSTVDDVDHAALEAHCLPDDGVEGWVGMGWGLGDGPRPKLTWPQYTQARLESGEGVDSSVQDLHDMPRGSLIWTRRLDSSYWLGEVTGPWEYHGDEPAEALDLWNVRRCRWWRVGTEDSVPGKIVNNFRASKTLNGVSDQRALEYSFRVHAQLTGASLKTEPLSPRDVIEIYLGAFDLEDLVGVYLQDQCNLVLTSRAAATQGYEYVLRDRDTGRRAVVSVKSGEDAIDLDRLPNDSATTLYGYAVKKDGKCVNGPRDIQMIKTDDLVSFIEERKPILPEQVNRWLDR